MTNNSTRFGADITHSTEPCRLLIFEPEAGGHQASHISHLVGYLLAERPNLEVLFALGPDLIAQLPTETRKALEDSAVPYCTLRILPASDLPRLRASNLVFRGLYQWFYLKKLARSLSVSHAHFHFFDHALLGAALPLQGRSPYTYSGLLFRPSMHYTVINKKAERPNERWRDRLKSGLYRRMLSNPRLTAVFSLDRYFSEYAARHFAEGKKVIAVPDPVPVGIEQLTADAPRMSPDRVGFLLFGALSERKGVLVALEALSRLADDVAARCHICFAGRVDPAIRKVFYARLEQLKSSGIPAHIEVVDRYLDDDEIPPMVSGADVILAPYVRHVGSSGVLYWAAAAGKPVITQDYGLVGREAREFSLGLTADARLAASLAEAMATAIRTKGQGLARPDGQARFIEGHTPDHFAAALIQAMAPEPVRRSLSCKPTVRRTDQDS